MTRDSVRGCSPRLPGCITVWGMSLFGKIFVFLEFGMVVLVQIRWMSFLGLVVHCSWGEFTGLYWFLKASICSPEWRVVLLLINVVDLKDWSLFGSSVLLVWKRYSFGRLVLWLLGALFCMFLNVRELWFKCILFGVLWVWSLMLLFWEKVSSSFALSCLG